MKIENWFFGIFIFGQNYFEILGISFRQIWKLIFYKMDAGKNAPLDPQLFLTNLK